MSRWTLTAFAAVLLCFVGAASHVQAQSNALMTRGVERFDEADFGGAIAAFDEAEAGEDGLSRADLVDLYARRANAHLAVGDQTAMQRDLGRLATLDPEHAFGPETRPEVRQEFESSRADREPLAVLVAHRVQAGAIQLIASVDNDPDGLTRHVAMHARVRGGDWRSADDSLTMPVVEGAVVEYYAVVIGPGGAAIANDGSEADPLVVTHDGATLGGGNGDPPIEPSGGDDFTIPLVIGGVVVAALIVVAVILIATSGSNDATRPDPPMIFPSM